MVKDKVRNDESALFESVMRESCTEDELIEALKYVDECIIDIWKGLIDINDTRLSRETKDHLRRTFNVIKNAEQKLRDFRHLWMDGDEYN